MSPEEKEQILEALRRGEKTFLEAVDGISPELAAKRPVANCWSALECVEHVVVAEEYLLAKAQTAENSEIPAHYKHREARILKYGSNRTYPATAPDMVLPTGRFPSLVSALEGFLAARQASIRFVESCTEDLRARQAEHPLFGTVTAHEALLLIVIHSDRHAKQIVEWKSPEPSTK